MRKVMNLLIAAILLSFSVPALEVTSGLADYQVVQVDGNGVAAVALSGTAETTGKLEARVLGVAKEILPWAAIGTVDGAQWSAELAGIPAGGPYRIELRIVDGDGNAVESAAIYEVLAGDIWLLIGQSNMQGVGNRVNVEAPDPRVHVFAMNHQWRLAEEPIHNLAESPDPVHCNAKTDEERQKQIAGWRDGPKGAGLGLPFAKEMLAMTGRPVGLIAAAHGGTSMSQWDPAQKDKGGESLYGSMYIQVMNGGGKVRGALWYQGESDANPDAAPLFRDRFVNLVKALRTDLNSPELPFYYVQIGRFVVKDFAPEPWHQVQVAQLETEQELAPGGMVPSIDLALNDLIHAGTPGLKTLGRRMALLAERDLFGGTTQSGPRPGEMKRLATPWGRQLKVKFSGVNGGLTSAGRLYGFSISSGPDGAAVPCIFNQEVDPESPDTVILWIQDFPENAHLWYGRGLNPYCNVVDKAGMALPVFGPVKVPE